MGAAMPYYLPFSAKGGQKMLSRIDKLAYSMQLFLFVTAKCGAWFKCTKYLGTHLE